VTEGTTAYLIVPPAGLSWCYNTRIGPMNPLLTLPASLRIHPKRNGVPLAPRCGYPFASSFPETYVVISRGASFKDENQNTLQTGRNDYAPVIFMRKKRTEKR